jgi:RNA polymerase sigma-70 factor (ECF subfamily)
MLESRDFPETRPSLLAELGKEGAGQSAWREFFERYAPAVFRVARMHRLDRHDADDIVQQVMVQVAGHIADFEYDRDRGRFRNWVRRIAEHKIMDFMRRRSLPVELDARPDQTPDDRADREAAWEEAWAHQDLEWCLDQVALDLAPRRMEAFRLYVLEGVSAAETAQRMDMTVGHVYVIRAQVINKLRKVMARLGGG